MSSIIVFLPMVFGQKTTSSIFLTQVAITMAIAHLASWLVAVSLVPMLSARLPPPKFIGPQEHHHARAGRLRAPHRRDAEPPALDDGGADRVARHQHGAAGRAHQDGHVPGRRQRFGCTSAIA
jgi:hypothetical protein